MKYRLKILDNDTFKELSRPIEIIFGSIVFRISVNNYGELVVNTTLDKMVVLPSVSNEIKIGIRD